MTKKPKSIISTIVLLALGILLVWFACAQVADEKEKIYAAFANANYFWVVISMLIAVFSHMVRAYRWNYLLEPLGYKLSFFNSCAAVFVGYFCNYAPIIRLGEVWRCTVTDRYSKIPFQIGFGTVITERIVDTLILLIIGVLTLLFQFSQLMGLSNQYIFHPMAEKYHNMSGLKLAVIGIIFALISCAFFFYRKKISNKFQGKFGGFIKGFIEGLSSIRRMKNFWGFVFLSFLIWTMYFYSLYFCLKALPETKNLGQLECLTIILFGTFGVAFAPGGLGAYQIIVTSILIYYGIEKAPAAAFPWLIWTAQFVVLVILGLLSLALLPIVNKNKDVVPQ